MNLRHLSFLVALAQERHFGRAAQSVHVTQSTLSAAIRQLERELGVPLVIRNRQRYSSSASVMMGFATLNPSYRRQFTL